MDMLSDMTKEHCADMIKGLKIIPDYLVKKKKRIQAAFGMWKVKGSDSPPGSFRKNKDLLKRS